MAKESIKKTPEHFIMDVNEVSRISSGVIIKGDISSNTDIRVDGEVEGKIYSEGRIVVGESASLKGSVLCTDLDMWGKVEGDIIVKNLLTLKSSSVVKGTIQSGKFQVEIGAGIDGTFHSINEEEFSKSVSAIVEVKLPSTPSGAPKKVEPQKPQGK